MANSKKSTTSEDNTGGQVRTGQFGTTGAAPQADMPSGGGSFQPTSGSPSGGQSTSGLTPASSSTGSTGGTATATARSFYDQAKETAGHAYEAAAEKATTKLEEQKTTLSGGLASVAGSVRQVSDNLRGPDVQDGISKFTAEYSELAAKKIEDVAGYFEQKSVRDMYSDIEGFARRNPAAFVGGAFVLGLLAARFLKSGARTSGNDGVGRISGGKGRRDSDTGSQADLSTV